MVSEDPLSLSYETGAVWVLSSYSWPSFSSLKAWSSLAPACCSCLLQALSKVPHHTNVGDLFFEKHLQFPKEVRSQTECTW